MREITRQYQTTDGLILHVVGWEPEQLPKAVVVIVHGYGEHSARYQHLGHALTEANYIAYAPDHRGHGKSDGERVWLPSMDVPLADLALIVEDLRAKHEDKPLFLFAHSMGSLIGSLYALKYPSALDGLILSGCAVDGDKVVPAPLRFAGRVIARLAPKLRIAPLNPDMNVISRDPSVVQAYLEDPLVDHQFVRAGTALAMIQAAHEIKARAQELRLPLYLLHGGDDRITPPSGAEYLYARAQSRDKQLKIYPNLRHEIINEPEKASVISDIIAWLDARVNSP